MIKINKKTNPYKLTCSILPEYEFHFSSLEGLLQWALEKTEKPDQGNKIVRAALTWVNEEKTFNPDISAQCAAFVRRVLKDCNIEVGVTQHPSDGVGPPNYALGPDFANSLAGGDIGEKISSVEDLLPGDLVFFVDTYKGNWPEHAITHVGIYVGNDYFVDRPTKSGKIRKTKLSQYFNGEKFKEGRRLH